MPELPEVQTLVNKLNARVLNDTLLSVKVNYKNILQDDYEVLINHQIKNIFRYGKVLIFSFDNDYNLIVHLRMEGKFRILDKNYQNGIL